MPVADSRRIAITGLGSVSALGLTTRDFWRALIAGASAIEPVERTMGSRTVRFPAALVPGYRAEEHFSPRDLMSHDRFTQFARLAAREAIADAGLPIDGEAGARTAIVLGTGAGGQEASEALADRLMVAGKAKCHPLSVPKINTQAPAAMVSLEHGITGPTFVICSGCAAANHAVAIAGHLLRSGVVDQAVAGGCEASVTYTTYRAFAAAGVLSKDTCRPFSRGRDGMALGEGAGIAVLETWDLAAARGAHIYAELAGAGMSSDAHDPVRPQIDGEVRAIEAALLDSGLNREDIEYVNAHGTGTSANDQVETQALHQVFGSAAPALWISSTKSMHGHALGASGGLELVASALALDRGVVPPTANYLGQDAPSCDLDYVPNDARRAHPRAAISNAFAFGGLNAVLALKRRA